MSSTDRARVRTEPKLGHQITMTSHGRQMSQITGNLIVRSTNCWVGIITKEISNIRHSGNFPVGLLPDTQNCVCACAGIAGNVFPVTACERSRHASRHVRDARAVMHAGISDYRFPLKSAAGGNVPGIPGACATCNFTYLVRGPSQKGTVILKAFPCHDAIRTAQTDVPAAPNRARPSVETILTTQEIA